MLKRFVQTTGKTAFVVEHDMMMATYLADRVVVYEGEPAVSAVATAPQPLQKVRVRVRVRVTVGLGLGLALTLTLTQTLTRA